MIRTGDVFLVMGGIFYVAAQCTLLASVGARDDAGLPEILGVVTGLLVMNCITSVFIAALDSSVPTVKS